MICERFGWLPSELDEQDIDRVLGMLAALNVNTAVNRVKANIGAHQASYSADGDVELYAYAVKLAGSVSNEPVVEVIPLPGEDDYSG